MVLLIKTMYDGVYGSRKMNEFHSSRMSSIRLIILPHPRRRDESSLPDHQSYVEYLVDLLTPHHGCHSK